MPSKNQKPTLVKFSLIGQLMAGDSGTVDIVCVILNVGFTQYFVVKQPGVNVRLRSSVVSQNAPSGASMPDAITVVSSLTSIKSENNSRT